MYTYSEELFSDFHKDTYGFRPRAHEFYDATPARKQEIWNDMEFDFGVNCDMEKQQEIASINALELEIAEALDLGAPSRHDAIRWIVQALHLSEIDKMYGGDYICYLKGLPYRMAKIFEMEV